MIIFGIWWWGSAGGVRVCIRVGVGWGMLDRVLPCSDACLRFQGFCFNARPDRCHWTGWENEFVFERARQIKRKQTHASLQPWADIHSIEQHCYEIWVTYGHTLSSQRLNKGFIAELKWGKLRLLSGWWAVSSLAHSYLSSLISWWSNGNGDSDPGLEHARDDTDTLDDTDGLLIACRSPYCPSANSTTALQFGKCSPLRRVFSLWMLQIHRMLQ